MHIRFGLAANVARLGRAVFNRRDARSRFASTGSTSLASRKVFERKPLDATAGAGTAIVSSAFRLCI